MNANLSAPQKSQVELISPPNMGGGNTPLPDKQANSLPASASLLHAVSLQRAWSMTKDVAIYVTTLGALLTIIFFMPEAVCLFVGQIVVVTVLALSWEVLFDALRAKLNP